MATGPGPAPGATITAMASFEQVSLEPDPVVEAYKKHVDQSLLRERLKLTPEERLRDLMRLQAAAEELRRAGRKTFP